MTTPPPNDAAAPTPTPAAQPLPAAPAATAAAAAADATTATWTAATPAALRLTRSAFGRLLLGRAGAPDDDMVEVLPVRAFPLQAPDACISLIDAHGHERAWLDTLDALDPASRALLLAELDRRDFVPQIQRLVTVSSFATPSVWTVDTDRGPARFTLPGEESIRRFPDGALLITDAAGINWFVRRRDALDRASRKLLERFL